MAEKAKQFRSLVIDTVNSLQAKQYMESSKKADYDTWFDYGKDIYNTLAKGKDLDPRDLYSIIIAGKEGTGKTIGVEGLDASETYYANIDKKPLSFSGWRKKYIDASIDEGGNYTDKIDSYDDLNDLIYAVYEHRKKDGLPFFIFYLAHLEDYKGFLGANEQRVKTLGKVANKQNIEGAVIHAYYTDIDKNKPLTDYSRYRFRTATTGFDTARSPKDYFKETYIPNNLQLIINRVIEMEY